MAGVCEPPHDVLTRLNMSSEKHKPSSRIPQLVTGFQIGMRTTEANTVCKFFGKHTHTLSLTHTHAHTYTHTHTYIYIYIYLFNVET